MKLVGILKIISLPFFGSSLNTHTHTHTHTHTQRERERERG